MNNRSLYSIFITAIVVVILGQTFLVMKSQPHQTQDSSPVWREINKFKSKIDDAAQDHRIPKPQNFEPTFHIPPYTYAKSIQETVTSPKRHVNEFERQEDVVIATKIHGRNNLITLEQSLCLLHFAYNKRVKYNIIVFYTDDLDENDMRKSRELVSPAHITFVKDSPPLQEVLESLPEERLENLMSRCRAKNSTITVKDIDWWTYCPDRINYNWQAEFRAWHIWRNPALSKYKYMLWLDSDGFATRPWHKDPVAYMINNDLVLFAAAYHKQAAGKFGGEEQQKRIFKSFNTTICDAYERKEKEHIISKTGDNCFGQKVFNAHGYFHITNLDFYRSDMVDVWSRNWIGDCFLCRTYDDQAALTVPALILAPERTWTMTAHDYKMGVYHNSVLDGKTAGGFIKLWNKGNNNITITFPEAEGHCEIKSGG